MSLKQLYESYSDCKMAEVLTPHYTWKQVDSSKLKEFMACPRKFFYRYVMGLTSDAPSQHLVAGAGIHEGMEYIALNWNNDEDDATLSQKAYELYLKEWRKSFPPAVDSSYPRKGPANVKKMFDKYVAQHRVSPWDVEAIEIDGVCHIGDGRDIIGRIDMLVRRHEDGAIAVVDHKTTSQMSAGFRLSWDLDIQMGAYLHMVYGLYPPEEVYGAIINALVMREEGDPTPLYNDDGTPQLYVKGPKKGTQKFKPFTGKGIEFERIPVPKTPRDMALWLHTANYWYAQIEREFEWLQASDPYDNVMAAFPMNPTSCYDYGSPCPYHHYCSGGCSNPASLLGKDGSVPVGFKREYWDPTKHEAVTVAENKPFEFDGLSLKPKGEQPNA